jgi:hypothetical protein
LQAALLLQRERAFSVQVIQALTGDDRFRYVIDHLREKKLVVPALADCHENLPFLLSFSVIFRTVHDVKRLDVWHGSFKEGSGVVSFIVLCVSRALEGKGLKGISFDCRSMTKAVQDELEKPFQTTDKSKYSASSCFNDLYVDEVASEGSDS